MANDCISIDDLLMDNTIKEDEGQMMMTKEDVDAFKDAYNEIKNGHYDDEVLRSEDLKDLANAIIRTKKRNTLIKVEDSLKKIHIHEMFTQAIKDGVGAKEAAKALIAGSNKWFKGSRNSMEAEYKVIFNKYNSLFKNWIEEHNLKSFIKGDHDLNVARIVDDRLAGLSDVDIKKKYNLADQHFKVADMYAHVYSLAAKEMEEAGLHVAIQDGYLGRATYDPATIKARLPEFVDMMMDSIDWEKTNDKGIFNTTAERRKFIEDTFFDVDGTMHRAGVKSVFRYMHKRKFIYKSAEARLDVMKEFGYTESLYDNMVMYVNGTSKRIAEYKALGSKPKEMLEEVLAHYLPEDINGQKAILNTYQHYLGVGKPSQKWAQGVTNLRTFGSAIMLQGATPMAMVSDLSTSLHLLVNTGVYKNKIEGLAKMFKEYLHYSVSPEYRRATAQRIASRLYHSHNGITRFVVENGQRGRLSQLLNATLEWNFMEKHTRNAAVSTASQFADGFLYQVRTGITPEMMKVAESFNISEHDIKMLKNLKGDHFSIEAFNDLEVKSPKEHLTDARYKDMLKNKLLKMWDMSADVGTSTPTLNEKATLIQATSPDTFAGQVLRTSTQFMPTALKNMNDIWSIANLNTTTGGKMRSLASYTIFTAMIMHLKEELMNIAYNRETKSWEDRNSLQNVSHIMRTSGLMGIWGDTFLAPLEYQQSDLIDLSGPSGAFYSRGAKIAFNKINKYFSNDDVEFTQADYEYILKLVPFANLPIVGAGTSHMAKALGE